MSTPVIDVPGKKKHVPYVPETMEMKEFTFRAVLIGLFLTALLGSANAYLGLKAGMTIAATYPAAVIGMALLRLMKGSLLEENIARTVGSIGESVAAGAVFTIPAFVMAGLWPGLNKDQYWKSVALMMIGGALVILFVTLLGLIRSMQSFEIELILGGAAKIDVYSTLIYRQVLQSPPQYGTATALSATPIDASPSGENDQSSAQRKLSIHGP